MNKFPSDEIKQVLIDLIKIQTVNPPGLTQEIVNYLGRFFSKHKIKHEIIEYDKNGLKLHNIIASIGAGKKKIVLSGHLDVVPPGDNNEWIDKNAFSGKEINGLIYGRGSADMKGGVSGILAVLLMLKDDPLLRNYSIVFAGTADEESAMTGAKKFQDLKTMNDAVCLIIPEATNLKVGIAEKGLLWAKVTVKGKAAHGSQPSEGINAIEEASKLFPTVKSIINLNLKNAILGNSTVNIGIIAGGSKINIVPDTCSFDLDYRIIPEEYDGFEKKLRSAVATKNTTIDITHELLPVKSNESDPFILNLCKNASSDPVGVTYATDGAILINKTFSPIPFVIYGPGDPTIIHKVNEHVPFAQVEKFASIIAKTIVETYK